MATPRARRQQKTPEEKEAERSRYAISDDSKEASRKFKAHIAAIVKLYRDLDRLTKKLYSVKGKQQGRYPSGETIDKKDLRALQTQFVSLINDLVNYRKFANTKAPKPHGGAAQKAPKLAYQINDNGHANRNLIGFFTEALKQGKLRGPNGEQVRIPQLTGPHEQGGGYTTNAELVDLFIIYAYANNLPNTEPGKSKFLNIASDPLFMKWFSTTLDYLEQKGRSDPRKNKKGESLAFNRNKFSYINLQQIISNNSTSKADMDEAQLTRGKQLSGVLQQEAMDVNAVKQKWVAARAPMKQLAKEQQKEAAKGKKKTVTRQPMKATLLQ